MRRIMIIGAPGSGKSTLARLLGDRLDLPVFHMDREVHWLPGWQERRPEDKPPIVQKIIAQDAWVFEGGNSSTYQARLARADMLIWLDVPLWLRVFRIVRRSLRDWGKTRPDLQDDCPEDPRMLPEFLRFVFRTHKSAQAKMAALFAQAQMSKHRLVWGADVRRFVAGLGGAR